jgi:alpha-galactosidase
MNRLTVVALAILMLIAQTGVWTMKDTDIPISAPKDAIMAGPTELKQAQGWASAAFDGSKRINTGPQLRLEVLRQDHGAPHFGKSCLGTPIKIGKQNFQHGLGTHANSEIVITLPTGVKSFKSFVGIDNNRDTDGVRGSVRFSVELDGKKVFHSQTLKGSDEPVPVVIDVPSGAKQLILKVDTTDDGPECDISDWADAQLIMTDDSVIWLDELKRNGLLWQTDPPFSFIYGGVKSDELLGTWERTGKVEKHEDFTKYITHWTDPKTGLVVSATARAFKDYPAVDWVIYFENKGTADTPILENIQALDTSLNTLGNDQVIALHRLHGDACGEESFTPISTNLETGEPFNITAEGGSPSQGQAFPFFTIQNGNVGIVIAIGWSGQWAATFERTADSICIRAGMEQTHFLLHPGEKVRSPRILLMTWDGNLDNAHNRFRRLMLFHFVPKANGRPVRLPIAMQCFDRYNNPIDRSTNVPAWATEKGQLEAIVAANEIGCDTHWFDAAWFEGDFPFGVGNCYPKPKEFPNGLKPLGDLCHKLGMRFVLWFEPERIAPRTQLAREHPEWAFGGDKEWGGEGDWGKVLNLGIPGARKWMTELLSKQISEYGVDVYREDFNVSAPVESWRQNDTPDRQGISEIRFVEGLYKMWDTLLAEHPGLMIDNCSAGGRRIDLETCMRSVQLWRSDTNCWAGRPDLNQSLSYTLGRYVPLTASCSWDPSPYTVRSCATTSVVCQFDFLNPKFPKELAKASLAEVKENQKYWYGDAYTLTPCSNSLDQLAVFQYHRADLNEGLILAFRRSECEYAGITVCLRGVDPTTKYRVELINEARKIETKTMVGKDLMTKGLDIKPGGKGSSMVIRYKPVK